MKLSRPFPGSIAPAGLLLLLREALAQRFYTGVSLMVGRIVSLCAQSFAFSLFSDASTRAWGAVLFRDEQKLVSRDYWPSDPSTDVNLLELRALLNALVSFTGYLSNFHVDIHIDNKVLKSTLDNDGCRNSAINEVVKEIYRYSRDQNFSIQTFYEPSSSSPGDEPSRKCSDLDCVLSVGAWLSLERLFGPHSFDLMSLASNCQKDVYGNPLAHYTPWATPGSAGINVFANSLPSGHNIYVFPPFVLPGPLLRYVVDEEFHGAFMLIVPDIRPRPFWWATIQAYSVDRFLLGNATRVPVRSYFSLASILKNGSLVLFSGTSGRSDVSASKYFLPYSAFDPQVPRSLKASRRCPACLYSNDVDANFC